jgi:ribonuclease HI
VEALELCLQTIHEVHHYLRALLADTSYDPHTSTVNHIKKLVDICEQTLNSQKVVDLNKQPQEMSPYHTGKLVISCDASIKENPGGYASFGIVYRFPDLSREPLPISGALPLATTNNQAEYDCIYEALKHIEAHGPGCNTQSVEIRTDSKVAVNQLNGTWNILDEDLKRRSEIITETLAYLRTSIPIQIVWYPRNSTEDLRQANNAAQDFLGVRNH